MDQPHHFSIGYFLFVALLLLALHALMVNAQGETIAYSDFKALLHAGRVTEVLIQSDTLAGTADFRGAESLLSPAVLDAIPKEQRATYGFVTARVPDESLVPELQTAKVRY